MLRDRLAGVIGLATIALLSGCQTAASLKHNDPSGVYSGVRRSLEIIEYNADASHPRMLPGLTIAICAVDLPFSAVADTLLLPYVLWGKRPSPERPHDETRPASGGSSDK